MKHILICCLSIALFISLFSHANALSTLQQYCASLDPSACEIIDVEAMPPPAISVIESSSRVAHPSLLIKYCKNQNFSIRIARVTSPVTALTSSVGLYDIALGSSSITGTSLEQNNCSSLP